MPIRHLMHSLATLDNAVILFDCESHGGTRIDKQRPRLLRSSHLARDVHEQDDDDVNDADCLNLSNMDDVAVVVVVVVDEDDVGLNVERKRR